MSVNEIKQSSPHTEQLDGEGKDVDKVENGDSDLEFLLPSLELERSDRERECAVLRFGSNGGRPICLGLGGRSSA